MFAGWTGARGSSNDASPPRRHYSSARRGAPYVLNFSSTLSISASESVSGSPMASNFSDIVRQIFLYSGSNKSLRLDATVASPESALEMATIRGAAALGLEREIGSIEAGKRADLILVRRNEAHQAPGPDPYSTLVYAARPTDVRVAIVDGEVLVEDGRPTRWDPSELAATARAEAGALSARAGL